MLHRCAYSIVALGLFSSEARRMLSVLSHADSERSDLYNGIAGIAGIAGHNGQN
jgi:hypothetical protein